MLTFSTLKKESKNLLFILLGALLIAVSVALFFAPNHFTTGGTPGLAILFFHLFNYSIGSMIIAINAPLLFIGLRYLGKLFALKTIFTLLCISFLIDFIGYLQLTIPTNNILLASLFGGLLIGFGLGFIIKGNASAGGSTIIAKIIASKTHIKASYVILLIDIVIVLASIYVFKDIEKALYSIISIYITAKSIDVILTGTLNTKVIHIASNKAELLSQKIVQNLGIQGTILKGVDFMQQENKTILFLVLDVRKISLLRDVIQQNDSEAFMIIMEASEMLGRGH